MNWPSWQSFSAWLHDCWIWCCQHVMDALLALVHYFINLFPSQPDLPSVTNTLPNYIINAICWVLPVPAMLTSLAFWSASVVIYFSVKAILRWL